MTCIVLASSPADYEIPGGAHPPRSQRRSVIPAFEQAVSATMGLLLSAERTGSYIQLFSGGWPEGMARHEDWARSQGGSGICLQRLLLPVHRVSADCWRMRHRAGFPG